MLDEKLFRELFYDAHVLHKEEYNVNNNRILEAIITLEEENQPKKFDPGRPRCKKLNYDDAAYRCGYLHLYASCHASLLNYVLQKRLGTTVFKNLFADSSVINICSIGGGPGTEVIGLCAMFSRVPEFLNQNFHFTVVDCMMGWRKAFESVHTAAVKETSYGDFMLSNITTSFLQADMLKAFTQPVEEAIRTADLVTMVKFVSAASSEATPKMLKDIFTMMKPGAAVLFIDKAGGGFYELVEDAAHQCGLVNHGGPFRHLKYENAAFRRKMYGSFALSCTTVAVQMWRKTYPFPLKGCEIQLLPERLLCSESSNLCHGSSAFNHCSSHSSGRTSLASKKTVPNLKSVAAVSCNISNSAPSYIPVPKKIDSTAIAKMKSQAYSSKVIHSNQKNLVKPICSVNKSDLTDSHAYSAICQDGTSSGTSDLGNESITNVMHNSSTNLCSQAPVVTVVGGTNSAHRRKYRALSSEVMRSSQNTVSGSNSKEDSSSNSDNEFNNDNSHVYHSVIFPNQTSAISTSAGNKSLAKAAGNAAKRSRRHTPGSKSSTSNAVSQGRNRRTRHNNRNNSNTSNLNDSTAGVVGTESMCSCSHAFHSGSTPPSATTDAGSRDHNFQRTDIQSYDSHRPEHRENDEGTTDCCIIL